VSCQTLDVIVGYPQNYRFASSSSLYDGTVTFQSFEDPPTFYLEDLSLFTATRTCANDGDCLSPQLITTDDDDGWGDSTSVQVQWAASQVLEFFDVVLDRDGMDGYFGPAPALSVDTSTNLFPHYVHAGSAEGAYYSEDGIFYGDGDGTIFDPAVSLDIVGHEMTHGMIVSIFPYDQGFIYEGESGSIEESICDFFGGMVERHVYGDSSNMWAVGQDYYNPPTGPSSLRFMDNTHAGPNNDPDHMAEINTDDDDFGGVHTNSLIMSKALYLLSVGGNHHQGGPAMSGIGIDGVIDVLYRSLTLYLSSNSDFSEMRTAMMRSTRDIYGANSWKYHSSMLAYGLCGIGGTPAPFPITHVQNPSFEDTPNPWSLVGSSAVFWISPSNNAHSERGYIAMGQNNNVAGSLSQNISIAANATASNVTFYLSTSTQETTTFFDTLTVSVKNATNGVVLNTFAVLTSSLGSTGWVKYGPYSIIQYKNFPLTIHFAVSNNNNLLSTTFKLDDIEVTSFIN